MSIKKIKEIELLLPDFETQEKYAQLLNLINEKIEEDFKQIENDRNLKQAILNDLWSQHDEI